MSEEGRQPGSSTGWRYPTGRYNYDSQRYWEEVGKPIIDEALVQGGAWTTVFDRELANTQWLVAPDELAIVYLLEEALRDAQPRSGLR